MPNLHPLCRFPDGVHIQPRENPTASLVLGMAPSFTNQASSFSERVHVLAVGWFYGCCLGDRRGMRNKIPFSGLGMVKPLFKSLLLLQWASTSHFQPLKGLSRELCHPGTGLRSWKWSNTHSQFSISHARGGEQRCR